MKTLKKIDTTTEFKKKKARRSLIKVMNDNCSAKQIINISIHSSFMMLWASWYSALQLNSGSVVMCHFFHHTVTLNNFFSFPLSCHYYKWKKNWLQKISLKLLQINPSLNLSWVIILLSLPLCAVKHKTNVTS